MEAKTRWETTTSVGILAESTNNSTTRTQLLLVRKRQTGLLGLPAGGLEQAETLLQAAMRELWEETNLKPDDLKLDPQPQVLCIPQVRKTSIGIIFIGQLVLPIPRQGYDPGNEEIDLVRLYNFDEVFQLKKSPDQLYKPEFNLGMINHWIEGWLMTKYAFEYDYK